MEKIEELGVLVDWEKGKIYKDTEGILNKLLSVFGKQELEEIDCLREPHICKRIMEHKIRWLYDRAIMHGKRELRKELSDGEMKILFNPDSIIVETPKYRMEYTAGIATLKEKDTGSTEGKELNLKEFHEIFEEMKSLLGYGDIEKFATVKAREVKEKQREYASEPFLSSGFLGFGGGFLSALLISELLHHAVYSSLEEMIRQAHTEEPNLETSEPQFDTADYDFSEDWDSFDSFDDLDMV